MVRRMHTSRGRTTHLARRCPACSLAGTQQQHVTPTATQKACVCVLAQELHADCHMPHAMMLAIIGVDHTSSSCTWLQGRTWR